MYILFGMLDSPDVPVLLVVGHVLGLETRAVEPDIRWGWGICANRERPLSLRDCKVLMARAKQNFVGCGGMAKNHSKSLVADSRP